MVKYYPDTIYATIYEDLKQKDGTESYYYRLAEPVEFKLIDGIISIRDTTIDELRSEIERRFEYMIDFPTYNFERNEFGFIYRRYIKYEDDIVTVSDVNDYTDFETYTFEFKWIKEINKFMNELE